MCYDFTSKIFKLWRSFLLLLKQQWSRLLRSRQQWVIILQIARQLKATPKKTCQEEFPMVASSSLVGSVTKECCHKDSVKKKTLLQRGFHKKKVQHSCVVCIRKVQQLFAPVGVLRIMFLTTKVDLRHLPFIIFIFISLPYRSFSSQNSKLVSGHH